MNLACQTPTGGSLAHELKRRGDEGLALVRLQDNLMGLLPLGNEWQTLLNPRGVSSAWFSGDGKTVVWGIYQSQQEQLATCPWPVVVEVLNEPGYWQLPGNILNIRAMAVSSDAKQVAFAGSFKPEGVFDPALPKRARWITGLQYIDSKSNKTSLILPFEEQSREVTSISFSPDGTQFVYDYKNRIFVYDVGSGSSRQITSGTNPTWSPNGKWIAFRSLSGEAVAVNATTFQTETIFGRRKIKTSVHWSPDSRYVAMAEPISPASNLVRGRNPVWGPIAQMIVERLEDHATAIVHLFDPEGADDRGVYWIPDQSAFMRMASKFPSIKACDESVQ
jgi:Periplasmic component of the Tol biopolymer transport system